MVLSMNEREGARPRNGVVGFIRGGNWNNNGNAGVEALNLNNGPGTVNNNIGFRCARYTFENIYFSPWPERGIYGCSVRADKDLLVFVLILPQSKRSKKHMALIPAGRFAHARPAG